MLQAILENYRNIFAPEKLHEIEVLYRTSLFNYVDSDSEAESEAQESMVGVEKLEQGKLHNFKSSLTNLKTKLKEHTQLRPAPPTPAIDGSFRPLSETGLPRIVNPNQNPIEENFSFNWNKRVNIENVTKQRGTNIPELVYSIVQALTVNKLYKTEYIYAMNMNLDEMKEFVEVSIYFFFVSNA